MYDSLFLRMAMRVLLPIVLVLSVSMLLRNADAPGNSFASGLLASAGMILSILVFGPGHVRHLLPRNPAVLAVSSMFVAMCWGSISLLMRQPFLNSLELRQILPGLMDIHTSRIFNVGVYVTVVGVTTWLALLIADEVATTRQSHAGMPYEESSSDPQEASAEQQEEELSDPFTYSDLPSLPMNGLGPLNHYARPVQVDGEEEQEH